MAKKKVTLRQALPYILIVAGIIGFYCSFILTQDKFALLQNPHLHLSCSLDPVISCGSVVQSKQGSAFGFPNPFLGLGAFASMATIGIAIKAGGVFRRWFWLGLEAGLVFAVSFVHWLFFQSVYRIQALCLYCMAVWIVTITSFWYVTLYNIDNHTINLPKGKTQKIYAVIRKNHLGILILWLLLIAGLILKHFWYYYGNKL